MLARRSSKDVQAGGLWSFPGGKVDFDVGVRVIEESLKREIREEVGLEIEDHLEFIFNDAFVRVSGHHVVMMVFLCFYKSGEAKALEDQDEVKWMNLAEMDSLGEELPGYAKNVLAALKRHEKIDPSE